MSESTENPPPNTAPNTPSSTAPSAVGSATLKFELEVYRQFIRDAAPFVSLVAGRKIRAEDAEKFTDEEMSILALRIDERAAALNKNIRSGQP
jgi:hypothetical protein